ncbi:MAG: hypothetical protein QOF30_1528, partial [Acidimicrobiaceae bacterium]|nr:hypothetical protein [Acidimicrobiaceae bacterium]
MARRREPADWERDLDAARPVERQVRAALEAYPGVTDLSDFTMQTDDLDFEFRLDGRLVRVDVKRKEHRSSAELAELWPEVPAEALFVLDETAFRTLVWPDGMGYLLINDCPMKRWHVLGPWELLLGPRRRFERLGDKGRGPFLKGKMLIDLRTAAETTPELSVDAVVRVARSSYRARTRVRAFQVPGRPLLPVIPVTPTATATRPPPPSEVRDAAPPAARPASPVAPRPASPVAPTPAARPASPVAPPPKPPVATPTSIEPAAKAAPASPAAEHAASPAAPDDRPKPPVATPTPAAPATPIAPVAASGPAAEVDPRWAGLDPGLVAAVKSAWGWDEPTPVQGLAIPRVLAGDNVLVIAPTA